MPKFLCVSRMASTEKHPACSHGKVSHSTAIAIDMVNLLMSTGHCPAIAGNTDITCCMTSGGWIVTDRIDVCRLHLTPLARGMYTCACIVSRDCS